MTKPNTKQIIATLHRETILDAAESLFIEKGYLSSSIENLSTASGYSRRTIYVYFENKEDIYLHIVHRSLKELHGNIQQAIQSNADFLSQYFAICEAMRFYAGNHPQSFTSVNQMKTSQFNPDSIPAITKEIFIVGEQINQTLEAFITSGIQQGMVRASILPRQTVYVLWSSLSALLSLIHTKEEHIQVQFGTTTDAFLQYGYTQIINSILENRI
jgi:AcrR family transcriptional regulator